MSPTNIPMGIVIDSSVTLGRVARPILSDMYQRTLMVITQRSCAASAYR